jgi:hypothetical protein
VTSRSPKRTRKAKSASSTQRSTDSAPALRDEDNLTSTSSVPLSAWVTLNRRYTRSVNLERDLTSAGSVRGYVITPRAADALDRILEAIVTTRSNRAFTLTAVYGTGKSAFAHFLASLAAPARDSIRADALAILRQHPKGAEHERTVLKLLPKSGLVRAVATARKESAASLVARALARGAAEFFQRGRKPRIVDEILRIGADAESGRAIASTKIPILLGALADAARTGVIVVLDELGKVLEHAAQEGGREDLYLLQRLAEIPTSPDGHSLVIVGLLHQTFSEYGAALAGAERAEWQKVQGRFEDIGYSESSEYLLALTRSAISHESAPAQARASLTSLGEKWHRELRSIGIDAYVTDVLTPAMIASLAPLHPVAAFILPSLCSKYAQHDRSLFAFLTSNEPHAFARFLREREATPQDIPLQRVTELYDYFVDVAGSGLAFRPQFQRWAEIHGVIADARGLSPVLLDALKTIGALNLIATAGPYRASRGLVLAALTEHPGDLSERERWSSALDALVRKGLVTYRIQLDEFRVWEGSEFDVDAAIRDMRRAETRPLARLLAEFVPLGPVVAQRHSYQTGTLRYFERHYVSDESSMSLARCTNVSSDGLILYWIGATIPHEMPRETSDGRPIVLVGGLGASTLRAHAEELSALKSVLRMLQLQTDGVARREVLTRIALAQSELEQATRKAFDSSQTTVWIAGQEEHLLEAVFNARLSSLCETTYPSGIHLWNELVNRRDLTSNGARARREVIDAMLRKGGLPRLGIEGSGPEASLYESVLRTTGIHREEAGHWSFGPPTSRGIRSLWNAIESFCVASSHEARTISELFELLDRPPYGIKRGVVPLVLAAVLLYHADDVSVYYQGSFVPVLGPEHFELLVKHPHQFKVKHFELTGIRWQVFHELEHLFRRSDVTESSAPTPRNASLLKVLRPLVRFALRLPEYSVKTRNVSAEALAVRDALRAVREPDHLLFRILPEACGLVPFDLGRDISTEAAIDFRKALSAALRELDGAYDRLLERCAKLIHAAFGTAGDPTQLRSDLRIRAQYLVGNVIDPASQSIVVAAINDTASDRDWLEALIMVIADRPADTWTDDDALAFEIRVADVARRFGNLWALVQEAAAVGRDGFDARRVTITRGDGREEHRLVWIEHHSRETIDRIVQEVLDHVQAFPREQQFAVAAAVVEAIFGPFPQPTIGATRVARAEVATHVNASDAVSKRRRRANG